MRRKPTRLHLLHPTMSMEPPLWLRRCHRKFRRESRPRRHRCQRLRRMKFPLLLSVDFPPAQHHRLLKKAAVRKRSIRQQSERLPHSQRVMPRHPARPRRKSVPIRKLLPPIVCSRRRLWPRTPVTPRKLFHCPVMLRPLHRPRLTLPKQSQPRRSTVLLRGPAFLCATPRRWPPRFSPRTKQLRPFPHKL